MASVDAVAVALRAAGFIAILQAAGIGIFVALFDHLLSPPTTIWVRRQGFVAAVAALVIIGLQLATEAARMGGDFRSLFDPFMQSIALHSSIAVAAAWKSAGLLLLIAAMARSGRPGATLAVLGAAITSFGFTRAGHTATHAPRAVLQALLCAHLMITAFWFGSLLPLIRAVRQDSAAAAAALVARFSAVATWLVPLLAIAGFCMVALLLKDITRLFTPYGALLAGKVLLFTLLMGLAALNRWRLGPALLIGGAVAARQFIRSMSLEYLLITATFVTTAVLTSLFSPDS